MSFLKKMNERENNLPKIYEVFNENRRWRQLLMLESFVVKVEILSGWFGGSKTTLIIGEENIK